MVKAYPSNLTRAQPQDFLGEMIPRRAKPGGRHVKSICEILNAIFHVLVEGVRWRSRRRFSGTAERYTPAFTGAKDEAVYLCTDRHEDWTRIEQGVIESTSEAIVDSQNIKEVRRW